MAQNVVDIKVNAQDHASGPFNKITNSMKLGVAAVATAAIGVGVASTKMAADFDKGMREVNTLLRLPEAQFKTLQGETLELSKQLGIVTNQSVPALYQAISAGVPRDNVMEFLTVAGQASIGGVTDLKTAVDGLTSVTNAYGTEALSAGRAADIMFTAVRLGKTTFGELSGALFNVVPSAVRVGIEFEEVAAALATLTLQGVPTAVATTQLRAAIDSLSAPTTRQVKLMAELGLSFTSAEISEKGLAAVFQEVIAAADGNDAVLRKLLGSVEALSAVTILGGTGQQAFADALSETQASAGSAKAAFDEMEKSTARLWDRLKTQVSVIMIELGQQILPLVNEKLEQFSTWVAENEDTIVNAFVKFGKAAEGFAKGLDVAFSLVQDLGDSAFFRAMAASGSLLASGGGGTSDFDPSTNPLTSREFNRRNPGGGFSGGRRMTDGTAGDLFANSLDRMRSRFEVNTDSAEDYSESLSEWEIEIGRLAKRTDDQIDLEKRLAAARLTIAERQMSEVVEAFIRGGDNAVAEVEAAQDILDQKWNEIAGDLRDKLGVEVPDEFRGMWESMLTTQKTASQSILEEQKRSDQRKLDAAKAANDRLDAEFNRLTNRVVDLAAGALGGNPDIAGAVAFANSAGINPDFAAPILEALATPGISAADASALLQALQGGITITLDGDVFESAVVNAGQNAGQTGQQD